MPKFTYVFDDQDYYTSKSIHSLYYLVISDFPNSSKISSNPSKPHRSARSSSENHIPTNIFGDYRAFIRFINAFYRDSIAKWSFLVNFSYQEGTEMWHKILKISYEIFCNNCFEISQNRILDLLKQLKTIQNEGKRLKLKNLNCLALHLIYHVKQMGRLAHFFILVYGTDVANNNSNNLFIILRKNKKPCQKFIEEQMIKFSKWKLQRWTRECTSPKESSKQSEIIITCKICLNKVPSRIMEVHSGHCLKRAEAFHNLSELLTQAPKHIEIVYEIKQCLVTKIKIDVKNLKSSQKLTFSQSPDSLAKRIRINSAPSMKLDGLMKPPITFQISSNDIFINNKDLDSPEIMQSLVNLEGNFQTKRPSEFARMSGRVRGRTMIEDRTPKAQISGVQIVKKKPERRLAETLFKKNCYQMEEEEGYLSDQNLAESSKVLDFKKKLLEEKIQGKKYDPLQDLQIMQSIDIERTDLNFSDAEVFQRIHENSKNSNGSLLTDKEDSYSEKGDREETFSEFENTPMERSNPKTGLILKCDLTMIKNESSSIDRKTPSINSKLENSPEEVIHSSDQKISRNTTFSRQSERKNTIRHDDKIVKACTELEKQLIDVCKFEFSKNSLRSLQIASQIAKEIKTFVENPGFAKLSPEFPKKVLDIIYFIKKVSSFGIQFLKFKTSSMRDVIKNKPSSPEKRSLALRNRIAKNKSRRSMLVLEKGRKSAGGGTPKSDSLLFFEKSVLFSAISDNKLTKETESSAKIKRKSDEISKEHEEDHKEELIVREKKSMAMAVSRFSPKRGIKRQESEISEFFLDKEPNIRIPKSHSPLIKKNRRRRSISVYPSSGSKQARKNRKSVIDILRHKNEELIKKTQRHLSFQVMNKKSEEGFRRSCFIQFKSEEEKKPNENSEEYAEKVKDAWMCVRQLQENLIQEEKKESREKSNENEKSELGVSSSGEDASDEESIGYIKEYYSESDMLEMAAKMEPELEYKEEIGIKDFEFLSLIGKGAYGQVFLVKRKLTDDLYAMKIINTMDNMNKNKLASLQTESKIFDLVTSEYVVKALFKFKHDVFFCFVMEYMHGGDFNRLLQTYGRLEEKIAKFYIAELVLAIEHLHSVGVVHRDLKPDNILLDTKGHIKLTDFGLSDIAIATYAMKKQPPTLSREEKFSRLLSKLNIEEDYIIKPPPKFRLMESHSHSPSYKGKESIEDSSMSSELSKKHSLMKVSHSSRRIVGTPDYIAPEILNGVAGSLHNPSIDWWSLGVILFEFLIGVPPFTDDTVEKIFSNILNLKVPWEEIAVEENETEETSDDKISKVAMDLMKKLLVLDPKERLDCKGIKKHAFFSGIEWNTLHKSQPPIVPEPMKKINNSNLNKQGEISTFLDRFIKGVNKNTLLSPIPEKHDLEQNIRFDLLHLENQRLARETLLKVKPCLKVVTSHSSTLPKNANSSFKKLTSEEISSATPELLLE